MLPDFEIGNDGVMFGNWIIFARMVVVLVGSFLRMEKEKMKVLLYLKKSGLDKSRKAPIMGRITIGRSIAQFSCKLSCNPDLWNPPWEQDGRQEPWGGGD